MQSVMSLDTRSTMSALDSTRSAMVLVVSAEGQILHFVGWKRALLLVSAGDAYVIETVKRRREDGALEVATIRTPSTEVPLPLVVGLTSRLDVPAVAFMTARTVRAGRVAVLRRDQFTCTYCGERGFTIDHIMPSSRGGPSTWQNLVTACSDCNGKKADRTPEEAEMPMLFDPRVFEGGAEDLQADVWRIIDRVTAP